MTQVINQNLTPSPVEVGKGSESTGDRSTAVGVDSQAVAQFATAFGDGAQALNTDTTAIGAETTAPANWNTVIGYDAGSLQNGENIVLIGRKSEGQGDDAVAIGENARANGLNSTVVGKATSALGDNSSAFGQGALVTSSGATVVGQGVSVDAQDATSIGTNVSVTGKGATGVGNGAIASAEKATALGNGAEANGINSLAIGTNSTTNQDNTFSFGNRNLNVPLDKSLLYPKDAGTQTLVKLPVSSSLSAGIKQEYIFDIGGKSVFSIAADSDGDGSVQNPIIKATDADISLSTGQSIKDGSGADRITLDSSEINVEGGDLTVDRNGDSADATLKLQSDISGGQEAVVSMFSGGNEVWRAGNNAAEDYIIETPDNNNTWLQFDKSAPRIDFSGIAADLRLATGQSIEDGSGTRRLQLASGDTRMFDELGNFALEMNGDSELYGFRVPSSSSKWRIRDDAGGFNPVEYEASASPPGIFRLQDARLLAKTDTTHVFGALNNAINGVISMRSGGQTVTINAITTTHSSGFLRYNSGDWEVIDESGNTTILT